MLIVRALAGLSTMTSDFFFDLVAFAFFFVLALAFDFLGWVCSGSSEVVMVALSPP